jgi:hypothetical protein
VHRYKYNTTTQTFDSTVIDLTFQNDQADSASDVGNLNIAFAPDGLNGYLVLSAYNKNVARNFAHIPYFSRTYQQIACYLGNVYEVFPLSNLFYGFTP